MRKKERISGEKQIKRIGIRHLRKRERGGNREDKNGKGRINKQEREKDNKENQKQKEYGTENDDRMKPNMQFDYKEKKNKKSK